MAHDGGSGRQNQDRNGTSGSNLLLWAVLVVATGLLLILWIPSYFTRELDPTDLKKLIEISSREEKGGKLKEGFEGYIDVREKDKLNRISNPHKIVISERAVTGLVDVVELAPQGLNNRPEPVEKTWSKDTAFRTNIDTKSKYGDQIASMLEASNIDFRYSSAPTSFDQNAPWILFGFVAIFLVYFLLRRLIGAGSPMAFGRSKGRLYAQEDLGVTFNDVAGIDEAVEEVREVVDFLKLPDKYQKLGGRIPKGVLLVGPPGTGKTLLAKAIAGEAGVPFFSLSGSDFVEMFVGVGAARVRDMFQQAEAKAPCIIFIDELDALGKSRGTSIVGGHDEREQTLNQLLVAMDGFGSNSGVIVMAATNRPETLDPALLRPGRFDRHVLVDKPDVRGREDILKVHVQNVKLRNDVNLKEVAGLTSGFVGA